MNNTCFFVDHTLGDQSQPQPPDDDYDDPTDDVHTYRKVQDDKTHSTYVFRISYFCLSPPRNIPLGRYAALSVIFVFILCLRLF